MADDQQLAKRLTRDARASAKAQARLQTNQAKAVRRREQARRHARRALPVRASLMVAAGAAVPLTSGADGFLWSAAVIAGVGALRSLRRLQRSPLPPLPAAPTHAVLAPPPDTRSAAWPAIVRLEAVRGELCRLLPLVAPAGRAAADEAWAAAAEADGALRWQAARLSAIEPHRGPDPELMQSLYSGVQCQERLVAAVADLVAASADPLASGRLQDATDRLHGLAQGLREVR